MTGPLTRPRGKGVGDIPNPGPRGFLAHQLGAATSQARADRGISRRKMAHDIGVSPITLRDVEFGYTNPTLHRVEVLADIYGLDVELVFSPRVES